MHRYYDPLELLTGDCIISPRRTEANGYVRYKLNGKLQLAHRLAYCVANKLTLKDLGALHIMHLCDVRNCVNPEHLRAGTAINNMQDKVLKGRAIVAQGATHCCAKLSVVSVTSIYKLRHYDSPRLAKMFNVSPKNIRHIWHRSTWGHLTSTLKGNFKPHSSYLPVAGRNLFSHLIAS